MVARSQAVPERLAAIRIGIGGWDFEPWRGTFYPDGLPKKAQLGYAAARLGAIEINATFYRTPSAATFAAWRQAVPAGFVFAVKAPRVASYTKDPGRAIEAAHRFVASGLGDLDGALGPILWQFPPTRKFDAASLDQFLAGLPDRVAGRRLDHALEARDPSFAHPEALAVLRAHGVARVIVDSETHTLIGDVTAPFVYLRLQRTRETLATGYSAACLATWAARLRTYAAGEVPADLTAAAPDVAIRTSPRPVYAFMIAGAKVRAPGAALALMKRLGKEGLLF